MTSTGPLRRCVVLLAALCAVRGRAGSIAPAEYAVKAAFIYNFSKYIEWPRENSKPFIIGVIGEDPFGTVLDDTVRGQRIRRREVVVTRFSKTNDIVNCDILFVAASEDVNLARIFATLGNAPVLTIGDMDRFAERGGMINLTTAEKRIRFEINVRATERVGLKTDSQLLRLARIVDESRSATK